jgi:hypothetical protein
LRRPPFPINDELPSLDAAIEGGYPGLQVDAVKAFLP